MNEAVTLELSGAIMRRAGANLAGPLSFRSTAGRLGLVGDSSPLLDALTGRAQLTAGSARVVGCELERALASGVVGLAASDSPVPASFTTAEYLEYAARLSHGSTARAATETRRALQRFGLADLASRKLEALADYQRRALCIALSTLTSPSLVWLDAPLSGLDAPSAEYVSRLCAEAALQARVVIANPWPLTTSFERALLETCEELLLIEDGKLLVQGPPSQLFQATGHYLVTVTGDQLEAFGAALRDAGCRLQPRADAGHWSLELPQAASTDLVLDLALEHRVIVLELEPVYAH